MTLPNKLTLGRILVIPAMIVIASIPYLNEKIIFQEVCLGAFINLILFTLASFTDFLDGHIARSRNLVTTFGKFADPLADKCLVLVSFLILMTSNHDFIPMWTVAVILVRELMISGVRLVAAERGEVIAAGWAGKIKTATTMVALIFMFLYGTCQAMNIIALVLLYVSVALTVYSGIEYLWNSRKIIFESI